MSICGLLTDNYWPVKTLILSYLQPYDIARLSVALPFLTAQEKEKYMNPMHDLFQDYEEIEILLKAGMRIMLLGCHLPLLRERLNNTTAFLACYGNDFVIDLIAIAYCEPDPIHAPLYARTPSLRFTVTDHLANNLGSNVNLAYKWLEHDLRLLPCTNSSLASGGSPKTSSINLQVFKLNLRGLWFNTIDFVYPDEARNIFELDEDILQVKARIISWEGSSLSCYNTMSYGSWLAQPCSSTMTRIGQRGTPALTLHRPATNMHEIMFRLEIPQHQAVGVVRVPTLF